MKDFLTDILAHKHREVAERKELFPVKLLERSLWFETSPVSLKRYLLREDLNGVIAEFKRKSPSRGTINAFADAAQTSLAYMQAGASALSVLTDASFFGGSNEDLTAARQANYCPILRKDFVVDEYQILEAKSIGADAVLLIAAALSPDRVKALSALAVSLGMEVLLELHEASELPYIQLDTELVGVNSRNLRTFETSVQTAFELIGHLPDTTVKIAESGLDRPETVLALREAGYRGFLIGEAFMRSAHPGKACGEFLKHLATS